jgi:hypothetical protein
MLRNEDYEFTPRAEETFRAYLERRLRQPLFAHARSVRNGIERARLRHANRVYEAALDGRTLTREDLIRLEPDDILKSSVFGVDLHDEPALAGADPRP